MKRIANIADHLGIYRENEQEKTIGFFIAPDYMPSIRDRGYSIDTDWASKINRIVLFQRLIKIICLKNNILMEELCVGTQNYRPVFASREDAVRVIHGIFKVLDKFSHYEDFCDIHEMGLLDDYV